MTGVGFVVGRAVVANVTATNFSPLLDEKYLAGNVDVSSEFIVDLTVLPDSMTGAGFVVGKSVFANVTAANVSPLLDEKLLAGNVDLSSEFIVDWTVLPKRKINIHF